MQYQIRKNYYILRQTEINLSKKSGNTPLYLYSLLSFINIRIQKKKLNGVYDGKINPFYIYKNRPNETLHVYVGVNISILLFF